MVSLRWRVKNPNPTALRNLEKGGFLVAIKKKNRLWLFICAHTNRVSIARNII